jgi:signal transduction histidine kinase
LIVAGHKKKIPEETEECKKMIGRRRFGRRTLQNNAVCRILFPPAGFAGAGAMTNNLTQKADFLNHLFDAIPSYVFVVDRDVRIQYANASAAQLLNADKAGVLLKRGGDALHCIHSTETPEGCGRAPACEDCVVRNSVNRSFQGGSSHRETTKLMLLHPEGTSESHVMVTACPLRYKEGEYCLLILEDITKLKNAEEALERRAAQLEAANEELAAFNYSVSHDLKAPLRSIRSFSEVLLNDYSGGLGDEEKDCLKRISSAGERMNRLIDGLLALSRATETGMLREEVDLSALANVVADELKRSFPDRDIEFVIAPGLSVMGDGRLLRVVLENLLGNAVKFSGNNAKARIEFGATAGKTGAPDKHAAGPSLIYCVRDNGAGFDMAHVNRLFTPFQRLHDQTRFPGSGIGLATVRRIIHRHGGRIWAEGAVDRGAAFFFTL